MLVSPSKEFIFIHIPKTAGTSIKYALCNYANQGGPANFLARRVSKISCVNPKLFYKYRTYNTHTSITQAITLIPTSFFFKAFKFSIVRNPYDRLISFYHHVLKRPQHFYYPKIQKLGSFENFIYNLEEINEPSQKSYLVDNSGRIAVDFIGYFENLDSDFQVITKKIGIEVELPLKNIGTRKENSTHENFYNERTREAVINFYKEDFETFGYKF